MNKTLKLKQTKENKQKFWSPLLDLLKITTPVTRSELQDAVGFSDRAVRNEVSNISKFHPVISYSSKKGYRLAQDFSKLNVEEAAAEWLEVEHSLNELKARNRDINKRMKPLIAYQKKMEKVRPEVLFEIEKKSRKEIIMKQTLLLKAKEIKAKDYICNLFGTVKEIEDRGSYLAIKYESNGHITWKYNQAMNTNKRNYKGGTNMNQVTLIGRLVKEPELVNAGDKQKLDFTLAVNTKVKGKADFIGCTAWGKTAEIMAKYLSKGSQVCVYGENKKQQL